jgi:hypothetical protein
LVVKRAVGKVSKAHGVVPVATIELGENVLATQLNANGRIDHGTAFLEAEVAELRGVQIHLDGKGASRRRANAIVVVVYVPLDHRHHVVRKQEEEEVERGGGEPSTRRGGGGGELPGVQHSSGHGALRNSLSLVAIVWVLSFGCMHRQEPTPAGVGMMNFGFVPPDGKSEAGGIGHYERF